MGEFGGANVLTFAQVQHDMRKAFSTSAPGYALAVVATAVAVGVRYLLDPWLGDHLALVTLFAAVAASVWFGGWRPAVLSMVLGYFACGYLFIEPRGQLGVLDAHHVVGLAAFLVSCAIIVAFAVATRSAQRRASERGELLRVAFASIGDGVITTDERGCVVFLNPQAESLTGWTTTDARGRPLEDVFRIVNEETRETVENPASKALRDGRIVGLANHTVLIARDGVERPIDDSAAPIRDARGLVTGCVLIFRDVSERRRSERALQRSERELSDFFENATIGLHIVGRDGIIERANQAELDLLGYERDEYIGHHIAEFHVDRAVVDDLLRRLTRGESVRDVPSRLRCKDGSTKDVLITSSGLFEDGRFVHSRCFTIDVTARRAAEQAQALLAAVVTASDDAIVTKSLEGIILSWNAGAERLFGHTAAEAVGQSIHMIIPPEFRGEERMILERLRRGERIDHFETVRVAKSGRRIDISLTVSPIRDATGRIIGASKVARDVTERKRSAEALARSEERFRELANNIDQFAWACDELGIATWYNQRWYDYTGTTFERMQGAGWKSVQHPDHLERVVRGLSHAVETGTPWEDTFPIRGKDGSYRWFLSRSIPIRDAQGRIVRWFGTNTDVTEQRELQEALEEADRRKDEFLATLAHELRNPLAPVRNAAQVLHAEGHADPQQLWAVEVIERQVRQMTRLLDDLLDVSRISHDKLRLRRATVDLASVIAGAVEASRPLIDGAGHELVVELPDEPVLLDADPVRLAQVFSNLLNNAAKYTDKGGHIRVVARCRGGEIAVEVIDDGIGIPPNVLPRIFDMFSQEKGALERSQGGLGIGLALAHKLVALHGGTIDAESDGPGRGSTFRVVLNRLPAELASPRVAVAPKARPDQKSRRRLLIVDDRKDAADSLALLLKVKGHDVRTAYDGEQALRVAEAYRPDVLLLDIGMPKMNGYEVCRQVRGKPWGRDLTVIALTGWGQDVDRRSSQAAGFDHHVVKPVDPERLLRLLDADERGLQAT